MRATVIGASFNRERCGEREHGRVGDQDVGAPRNGREKCGGRLDAVKHQPFGAHERGDPEPAVHRKGQPPRRPKKTENESRDRRRSDADADLHHVVDLTSAAMLRSEEKLQRSSSRMSGATLFRALVFPASAARGLLFFLRP